MQIDVLLLTLGLLVYGALGGVMLRLWRRRTPRPSPAIVYANPSAGIAYWLPQLIAMEAWTLIGTAAVCCLLTLVSPLFKRPEGATVKLTFVFGLLGSAVLLAALDAVLVVRVRRMARRQAGAHPDDATPPS